MKLVYFMQITNIMFLSTEYHILPFYIIKLDEQELNNSNNLLILVIAGYVLLFIMCQSKMIYYNIKIYPLINE